MLTVSVMAHEIPDGAVDFEKSEQCATCHQLIYNEWKQSFHSMASLHKDKAHEAAYKNYAAFMKKNEKSAGYPCGNCHTPMADNLKDLISGKAIPDSDKWKETDGVGCSFCHRVEAAIFDGGQNFYRLNKDGAVTIGTISAMTPHSTTVSKAFLKNDICTGCHRNMAVSAQEPGCVMGNMQMTGAAEIVEGRQTCMQCHMGAVDGASSTESKKSSHASHLMMGGHDTKVLAKAVKLDARVDANNLIVDIQSNIPHNFPSTNPMRMAFLKVTAKDEGGNVLWSNFKESPMEDKKGLFMMAFKKGEQVGVPAWVADNIAFDKRITGKEKRSIEYKLPSDGIKSVTVELYYRFFAPAAIKNLEIPQDGVNEKNHLVLTKEIRL
ncbi:hypothetical protein MBAV_003214 [Candidatus Magnetobacterium bavaricum]|uniref:Cytochrome c-552/4 domain-containing protein n=1 Tax=Candidatus Magnetobacterium bavaricum TaxID=29290 RepID=A0A0F3GV78_9BACT|nr:hypothetical protein MBAV_003214 [Candidatus Magnetobacterium bavaricum]